MVLCCCAHRYHSAHSTSAARDASVVFRSIVHGCFSHSEASLTCSGQLRAMAWRRASFLHIAIGFSWFCVRLSGLRGLLVRTTMLVLMQVDSQTSLMHAHARTRAAMVESIHVLTIEISARTQPQAESHCTLDRLCIVLSLLRKALLWCFLSISSF